ncbi:hypothetical protein D3C72_2126560 [compost metagenome]
MLPLQLGRPIPHQAQERLVGLQDRPVRGEDDGRYALLNGLDEALLLVEPALARQQLRLKFVIEHGTP